MARTYQHKFLEDGITPNPKYKPDTRKGDRHKGKEERSKEDRHSSSYHRGSRYRMIFISIDGEGVDTNEVVGYTKSGSGRNIPVYKHKYVLIMASSGESDYDEGGLSTERCFEFLLMLAKKYPNAIFVCYGASYDTNIILSSLPISITRMIYERSNAGINESPVKYRAQNGNNYAITYRHRKSLTISRQEKKPNDFKAKSAKRKDGTRFTKYVPNYGASFTLWDISSFFQCRFVDALGDKEKGYFVEYLHTELIDGVYHEIITWPDDGFSIDLTIMKKMKKARSSFTTDQIDTIKSYCRDEVKALEKLMSRLREYLEEADLLPYQSRWLGPGACAATLLHRYHIKEHMYESTPIGAVITTRSLIDAKKMAFSGGRFELGQFGIHIGKLWYYDQHSAFPSIMPELPSLTNGMWRTVRGISKRPYSIIHIRWSLHSSVFYPFFYRLSDGSIYYPSGSQSDEGFEGWYWKPEVDMALKMLNEGKLKGSIEAIESWEFQPYSDVKPFAFVHDIYNIRLQLKKSHSPVEKVLKFTINSIYGKEIQSLGWTSYMDGYIKEPTYHNIGYAGYITASVRAKMFEAIMQSPDSIVSIVSDGLFSLKQLNLPLGDGMGQWEEHELDGIISVAPGIYFSLIRLDHEPAEQERQEEFFDSKYLYYNGEWFNSKPRYQGYDRGSITPDKIINVWKKRNPHSKLWAESTRFVTLKSALSSEYMLEFLNTWRRIDRKVSTYPGGKRSAVSLIPNPSEHLEPTLAEYVVDIAGVGMSNKFKLAWEEDDNDTNTLIDDIDMQTYIDEHIDSEL